MSERRWDKRKVRMGRPLNSPCFPLYLSSLLHSSNFHCEDGRRRFLWHIVQIYRRTRCYTREDNYLHKQNNNILKSHNYIDFSSPKAAVQGMQIAVRKLSTSCQQWPSNSILETLRHKPLIFVKLHYLVWSKFDVLSPLCSVDLPGPWCNKQNKSVDILSTGAAV